MDHMTQRLFKEFRPLFLAWGIGLIAGSCALTTTWEVLGSLSAAIYVGCMAAIAALPFGSEFQQRTISLLLAQPMSRARVWVEKVLLVLGLFAIAGLLCAVAGARQGNARVLLCASLLMTACSAPFWTLVARSTIGGAVLTIACQFLGAAIVSVGVDKLRGGEFDLQHSGDLALVSVCSIAYSAVFLLLGWRKFARLELNDAVGVEGTVLSATGIESRWWSDWLRCRPHSSLGNLLRKELRLQKPLFLIAGVFVICWLVTLAVDLLEPSWREYAVVTFNVLTVVQLALIPVLAGCLSLGEEKLIGLTAWHLTLPVAARRQWLTKLGVNGITGVVLGVVLPWALALITLLRLKIGLIDLLEDPHSDGGLMLVIVTGVPFVLSFWAATLVSNAVRAALLAVVALPILWGCAALGLWIAHLGIGLQTPLFTRLMARLQLPPDSFAELASNIGAPLLWAWAIAGVGITLAQSLAQFRRAQAERRVLLRYSAWLAGFVFISVLWMTDAVISAQKARQWPLSYELYNAIVELVPRDALNLKEGETYIIPLPRLFGAHALSNLSRTWLHNSIVSLRPSGTMQPRAGRPATSPEPIRQFQLSVQLPSGRQFVCTTVFDTHLRRGTSPAHPAIPQMPENDSSHTATNR